MATKMLAKVWNEVTEQWEPIATSKTSDATVLPSADTVVKRTNTGSIKAQDPQDLDEVVTQGYLDNELLSYLQPVHSGEATFTGIDNKIVMEGIVTALGLEIGDVIGFSDEVDPQNQKLRTVEAIIDDDTIVVNYEHCGGRGDGSLKLEDETDIQCEVKRISKWFIATSGLGQEWVNIGDFLIANTARKNDTGRCIQISYFINASMQSIQLSYDGVNFSNVAKAGEHEGIVNILIPRGFYYKQTGSIVYVSGYTYQELR